MLIFKRKPWFANFGKLASRDLPIRSQDVRKHDGLMAQCDHFACHRVFERKRAVPRHSENCLLERAAFLHRGAEHDLISVEITLNLESDAVLPR